MHELYSYASVELIEAGFRPLTAEERLQCQQLITEAGVMIDRVAPKADFDAKCVATCRMVRRAIGTGTTEMPVGASQGSVSALGYSQSWTMGTSGGTGELYIGKAEKALLGVSNKIGASNPFAEVPADD